jgi:thiamine biosynthesis protein ThiS
VGGEPNPHKPRRGERYATRMKLHINGDEKTFDSSLTLAALVEILGMKADRVAVELNLSIIPRDGWAATSLNDGDRLEIVHFVGGGLPPDSRQELS